MSWLINRACVSSTPEVVAAPAPQHDESALFADAELTRECEGYAMQDARTWLHTGMSNHFGSLSGEHSRALLRRLFTAGALSANVAVDTGDAEGDANTGRLVLIQRPPFNLEALVRAATTPAANTQEVGEPHACVMVSESYVLLDFDDCE